MVLQKILFHDGNEKENQLYLRSIGRTQVEDGKLKMLRKQKISTDTYMNAFDLGVWKKYTCISRTALVLRIQGKGRLKIFWERQNKKAICLKEEYFEKTEEMIFRYAISDKMIEGIVYFEFIAEEETFLDGEYEAEEAEEKEIKLAMIICTYHRKKQLERILEACSAVDWLRVVIVDNASELKDQYGERAAVYHNLNTGGAGGFSRGMEEIVKNFKKFPVSHTVLMDDDVMIEKESLCRLRALLTYLKKEYEKEVVAGRMFRLDMTHVQYTAAEIWNGGDIKHIGWNQDMTDRSCLWNMNYNEGAEYSGWWFACYPIDFVRTNNPMPFFMHCDDVEYGLRQGGTPIIMNGIQVWHETYEHRQSPIMAYYDVRNSLFVNEIYGIRQDKEQVLSDWKEKIAKQHVKKDYLTEYMMICGLRDYCKGLRWLCSIRPEQWHKKLCKRKTKKWKNAIMWRLAKVRYLAIFADYMRF